MCSSAVMEFSSDKPKQWSTSFEFLCIVCLAFCTVLRPASANASENSTMNVSEYPFSDKLSNPCAVVNASLLQNGTLTQESKEEIRKVVNHLMKVKASLLKENAESILRMNVLEGCSSLQVPSVAVIPSADNITENIPIDALRLFYNSLLNHTGHAYFTSEQIQHYAQVDTCNNADLSNVTSLPAGMRDLMCYLRLSILTLEQDGNESAWFNDDSTDQILREQLTDQPLCSRRFLRDCQAIRSTVTLLRELSNYLEITVLFDDVEVATS